MRILSLVIVLLRVVVWSPLVAGAMGPWPCDAPPYDPMVEVASPEAALEMDRWAVRALRRDLHGRTCADQQEVVDILLVRWLQAHPEIHIELNGAETGWLMNTEGAFLLRLKAEAWAECKGRRAWFPRSWGRLSEDRQRRNKRDAFVRRAGEKWGGRKK